MVVNLDYLRESTRVIHKSIHHGETYSEGSCLGLLACGWMVFAKIYAFVYFAMIVNMG